MKLKHMRFVGFLKAEHLVFELIKDSVSREERVLVIENSERCHVIKDAWIDVILTNPFLLDNSVHHSTIKNTV